MFIYRKDCQDVACEPGVTRKVLAHNDTMMMCEVSFCKDAKGNFHSHPHLQVTYVAEGRFLFAVGTETSVVSAGDSVMIAADRTHGVTCLEAGKLIDIFHPAREDFVTTGI